MFRFPLSSEQLELLVEFSAAKGLDDLARRLAKDPSVVSRRLQRLSEDAPVLVKKNKRWVLTELGQTLCQEATAFVARIEETLSERHKESFIIPENAALVVINSQKALRKPNQDFDAEPALKNIAKLLAKWRNDKRLIFHVRHISNDLLSPFHVDSVGSEFFKETKPEPTEIIVDKRFASAFRDTGLQTLLANQEATSIVIVGFTGNECIDATARDGNELGFHTIVVSDASASFGFYGTEGSIYLAERVHHLMLSNLAALYSTVLATSDICPEA